MANGRLWSTGATHSSGRVSSGAGSLSPTLTKAQNDPILSRMIMRDLTATIQAQANQADHGFEPLCLDPKQFQNQNQDQEAAFNNVSISMAQTDVETCQSYSPSQTPRVHAWDATQSASISLSASSAIEQNPLRQDSAYFSMRGMQDEGFEFDDEAQVRQMRARERVVIWRERVSRTRHRKREMKPELRRLRENARKAFEKLTRKTSEAAAFGRVPDNIEHYYEMIRVAQDELGPVEDAYDRLESRLDEEEEELELEEDHFYRSYKFQTFFVPENKIENPLSPLLKPYEPPDSDAYVDELEGGLKGQYLEKKQEAERLKRELENLEEDYFRLSEEAKFRTKHGLRLNQEAATFLSDYPESHKDILNNLHQVENILFSLRNDCLQQGLFTESEYAYEPRDLLNEDIFDFIEEIKDKSPLRVAARHLNYVAPEGGYETKQQYINNWLLDWIQDSSVDKMMLEAQIYIQYPDTSEKFQSLDNDKWSELALWNWNTDSMGKYTDYWFNQSRMDAIAGDTGKLENSSTGLSGVSTSLRSLDAMIDAEERLENVIIHSDSASLSTELAKNDYDESTPKKLDVKNTIPVITTEDFSPTSFKNRSAQLPPAPHSRPKSLQLPSRKDSFERATKRLSVDFSSINKSLHHSISFRSL